LLVRQNFFRPASKGFELEYALLHCAQA
jgi:hypothetical protein